MTTYPDTTAGVRVTSDLLTGMLDNYVLKGADTTRASTVTNATDPDLQTGTLQANGVYLVEFMIQYAGLSAAGLRTAWSVPTGTTGNKKVLGPAQTNATNATDAVVLDMRMAVHNYTTTVLYTNPRNSVTLQTWAWETALVTVGTTSGIIALQWAQNVTNATGSVVASGSYVRYRQIG